MRVDSIERRVFEKVNIDETMSSVCLSIASQISETSKAIAIKFDTVTASVIRMHQFRQHRSTEDRVIYLAQ